MIKGAIEIIHSVPVSQIDPLVLPEALGSAMRGYIVIAHRDSPGTFDLIFLEGNQVQGCGRMHQNLRITQKMNSVRDRLLQNRNCSFVYLYQVSQPGMDRFIDTFNYEPCLRVQVDPLSRKQLVALLASSGCTKGILEFGRFAGELPSIELHEFESPEQLLATDSRIRNGWLLLYDLERSAELLNPGPPVERPQGSVPSAGEARLLGGEETAQRGEPPAGGAAVAVGTLQGTTPPAAPGEFTKITGPGDPESSPSRMPDPLPGAGAAGGDHGDASFVRMFGRVLRSFRQQAFECFGGRLEKAMQEAELSVRLLNPDFDLNNLTPATAPEVLDLMKAVIKAASVMRRSKLRASALMIVSELYNKNYDALLKRGAVDRVEEFYYRLKD